MSLKSSALKIHKKLKGKIEIASKFPIKSSRILSLLYTPGVAEVSREIYKRKEKVYEYTSKWNSIAIVTDGSRVLGLGDIGPEAALPVMEGKSILFKLFGKIDAFPLCLATKDPDEIISVVKAVSPVFGGISIEDIDAPKVFGIVEKLVQELDIPVFHDDQHGTAIVTLAALKNALKVVGKNLEDVRITIAGAGAAGYGVAKILYAAGARNIIVTDTAGIIYQGRKENMNKWKVELSKITNRENFQGNLTDAIKGADVFIGLSGVAGLVNKKSITTMNDDAIVFPLTNPFPEINPEVAKKAGAKVVGSGRSDLPNQINNSLVFPGFFRGLLDVRARKVNMEMMLAASEALVKLVSKPKENYIVPHMMDWRVMSAVAKAVMKSARETKVAK